MSATFYWQQVSECRSRSFKILLPYFCPILNCFHQKIHLINCVARKKFEKTVNSAISHRKNGHIQIYCPFFNDVGTVFLNGTICMSQYHYRMMLDALNERDDKLFLNLLKSILSIEWHKFCRKAYETRTLIKKHKKTGSRCFMARKTLKNALIKNF